MIKLFCGLGFLFLKAVTFYCLLRLLSERGEDVKIDILEEVYLKYYSTLFIYAFSLCNDTHLAQDLTSETFLKAFLSLNSETTYFKFWLFKVCKNLFVDYVRKNKKYSISQLPTDILSEDSNPEDMVILSEEKNELMSKIMGLKEFQREVIVLFYYGRFNIEEISKMTGLSKGAVKTTLHRARILMRSKMEVENGL